MTNKFRTTIAAAILGAATIVLTGCPAVTGALVPGATGSAAPVAAACTRTEPSQTPVTGTSVHGQYNNQRLPYGYDAYKSEAEVTAAIAKEDGGANWACFQAFYPGASTLYLKGKK